MVLAMSRPWKHPDSGVFYLRRAVPDALKPVLGKTMEKVSLGTRDPAEARVRHAEMLADLELRWLALKKGTVKLSHKQIVVRTLETLNSGAPTLGFGPGSDHWDKAVFETRSGNTDYRNLSCD